MEVAIALVVLAAGALALWGPHFRRRDAALRRLERARSSIKDAQRGFVCLTGTVAAADGTLLAPLSGKRCLAYAVEALRPASTESVSTGRGYAAAAFWLADATGRARIEPGHYLQLELGGPLAITADNVDTSGRDAIRDLIESSGGTVVLDHHTRFRECVLMPGDTVSVGGYVTIEPHPEGRSPAPYRSVPVIPVIRDGGFDEDPLVIVATSPADRRDRR